MADDHKIGKAWSDDELDLIVADYFSMLSAEREGRSYVKARHRAHLMDQIGRTNRSVEFKHMNISAVLRELGLPWIGGYRPKANYQGAIVDAVDRYLSAHPSALHFESALEQPELSESATTYIEPAPALVMSDHLISTPLDRLVRKFDPVVRDFRNRKLGKAGEELVLEVERQRLAGFGRHDLVEQIRWVAEEDGDGAGYDVHSFEPNGAAKLIEVKTTCGSIRTPFYVTRNELALSEEQPTAFRIYRVFEFAATPRLFELAPPLRDAVRLNPMTYRASFSS